MNAPRYGFLVLILGLTLAACGEGDCPTDADLSTADLPCICGAETLETLPADKVCQCSAEDGKPVCTEGAGDDSGE